MINNIREQGPYSQHFIFFVSYERGQLASVLHDTMLESLCRYKHFSLLGPLVTYKKWSFVYTVPEFHIYQNLIYHFTTQKVYNITHVLPKNEQ